VSLKTGIKCLQDSWFRTKCRLGWAISPATGAAWMQAAAPRMGEHVGESVMVFSNSTNDWHAAEVVEEKEDWVDVEFELRGYLCRKRLQRHSAHLKPEDEVPRLMAEEIAQQAQVPQARC